MSEMRKRNYNECKYNYGKSYQNSLLNRITVNKNSNINSKTLRSTNYRRIKTNSNKDKDNLYYEKKLKLFKNKNLTFVNRNKRNKLSEEKINDNKIKYYNKEPFKKTINTYSNENRYKDRNIFEELQNNKYLKPMLVTTNIDKKLLKCKIEEPIKNMCSLSLRNYFSNVEFPVKNIQSPKKDLNEAYDEDNINLYNLNNRTVMDRFNININCEFSPANDNTINSKKNNSSSFVFRGESNNLNNNLLRYAINNVKNYPLSQFRKMKNEQYDLDKKISIYDDESSNKRSQRIYQKNVMSSKGSYVNLNNLLKNYKSTSNSNSKRNIKTNLKSINNSGQKDKILLQIYKKKLVEEFIILLNKFHMKYYNKIFSLFFTNLSNFKKEKNIYLRKKNSRVNIKKLTDDEKSNKAKYQIQATKSKLISDSMTIFNNKSYSNEFKSTSLTSNLRSNNNNNKQLIKLNSSFVLSEQKRIKHDHSPEDSLNKYLIGSVRKKIIIPKKRFSGTNHRIIVKSPSQVETRKNDADIFVYKKKNLNNDNLCINKNIKNNGIYDLKLNCNKYNKIITNNKQGKIIDIDINLGKPINVINDHSPLQQYILETNKPKIPKLFKLNTFSTKFMNIDNNKTTKKKTKSGSKKKIKPPLRLKRFLNEIDDDNEIEFENINCNLYDIDNRPYSSVRKNKSNNNSLYFENNYNYNKENDKLFIRFNYFYFFNEKQNIEKDLPFKNLTSENNISIKINNNRFEINEGKNDSQVQKRNININRANKLYINCTKFLEKIINKIIKKKVFIILSEYTK